MRTYTPEERKEIATTIYAQLGGRKFGFMVGAKNLVSHEAGLSFRIPGTMTKGRMNYVKITLTADDDYNMEFGVIRGHTYKIAHTAEGIYADNLADVFRDTTGLETRMPRFA